MLDALKNISQLRGRELKWTQPHALKLEYELRADDELAATLRFKNSLGSLATAECADGCWTFKRVGFWETKATIRVCGSEDNIAIYKNKTWNDGGTLELPDGRKYLANLNFWATQYEFKTEGGELVLRYTKIGGLAHFSSMMEIFPTAVALTELPWMAMLGWYLTVMIYQETAAAVMVTIAAS